MADLRRPNSFNFMQFLREFGNFVCSGPLEGSRPHLGEILDPTLDNTLYVFQNWFTALKIRLKAPIGDAGQRNKH